MTIKKGRIRPYGVIYANNYLFSPLLGLIGKVNILSFGSSDMNM